MRIIGKIMLIISLVGSVVFSIVGVCLLGMSFAVGVRDYVNTTEEFTTEREIQLKEGQSIKVRAIGDEEAGYDNGDYTKWEKKVEELESNIFVFEEKDSREPLVMPTVVMDNETGIAKWKPIAHASHYLYKIIKDGSFDDVEDEIYNISSEDPTFLQIQLEPGERLIVKASAEKGPEKDQYRDSYYSQSVKYIKKLDDVNLNVNEETLVASWDEVSNAKEYGYVITGGKIGSEKSQRAFIILGFVFLIYGIAGIVVSNIAKKKYPKAKSAKEFRLYSILILILCGIAPGVVLLIMKDKDFMEDSGN